ncbi:MAG: sulfatase-like hydrolase/transferase [Pirellulaceae bacterium]|nr:sulfatase-like hydrolase/transferase [Planctomycetales bacterium]
MCWKAFGGLLLFSSIVALAPAAEMPDFVVFLSDDHGCLDSQPYGAADVRTPNMQRLADVGMTFERALVASPSCAPSRAALLTGLMPARNGAEANHSFKRDNVASLPAVLQRLGYQTVAFGKVAHGPEDVKRHGFDVYDRRHSAEFIETFLRNRDRPKPLCMFVGTHEPHVPWPDLEGYDPEQVHLPETFIDTAETREFRTRYYTDVTKADALLGDVVRRYHERPELELYDLQEDPNELNNLAARSEFAQRVREMHGQLEQWMMTQNDTKAAFHAPRRLSDPSSTRPGNNTGTDTPDASGAGR